MPIRDDFKSLALVLAAVGAFGILLLLLPPSDNQLWVSFALFGMGAAGGYGIAWRMRSRELDSSSTPSDRKRAAVINQADAAQD